MCVCMSILIRTSIYICVCVYIYMCVCVYVYMSILIRTYVYRHIYICSLPLSHSLSAVASRGSGSSRQRVRP